MIEIAGTGDERVVEVGPPRGVPATLPVLPLRETVPLPDTLTPLAVGQERSVQLVNDVLAGNRMLVMVASKDPELETPGPIHVDFELSHHCQLKCPMCPFGLPSGHRPAGFDDVDGFMAFDLYKKVIDEGISLGLKSIQLSFYNEPLLRKDLVDLIQYAAQQGIIEAVAINIVRLDFLKTRLNVGELKGFILKGFSISNTQRAAASAV